MHDHSTCGPHVLNCVPFVNFVFFFLNKRAPPEISPLPLHAPLPISIPSPAACRGVSYYEQPATPIPADAALADAAADLALPEPPPSATRREIGRAPV